MRSLFLREGGGRKVPTFGDVGTPLERELNGFFTLMHEGWQAEE